MNLYIRYLFPNFLLRDASTGNLFARAAALRHNVAARNYLLTYCKRWLILGMILCGIGMLTEQVEELSILTYLLKVLMVGCVAMYWTWFTVWACLLWESKQ